MQDIDDFMHLALDPKCTLLTLYLQNLPIRRLLDFNAMIQLKELVKEEDCYKHKLQCLDFSKCNLLSVEDEESSDLAQRQHENLEKLLEPAERLPYLYEVGVDLLDPDK